MHALTTSALRAPAFFELPSLRLSIISVILDLTANAPAHRLDLASVRPFELLLALPTQYVPLKHRQSLVQRALSLEKSIKLGSSGGKSAEVKDRARATLRGFVALFIADCPVRDHLSRVLLGPLAH